MILIDKLRGYLATEIFQGRVSYEQLRKPVRSAGKVVTGGRDETRHVARRR